MDLNLISAIAGDEALESALLLKFADKNVRGEWFAYSAKIVAEFKRLQKEADRDDDEGCRDQLNQGNPSMAVLIFSHALHRGGYAHGS